MDIIFECYCCKKALKKAEGDWIRATEAKILRDKTEPENRLICKGCNHLEKK